MPNTTTDRYTFEAGPDGARYTVETPWDAAQTFDVCVKLTGRLGWSLDVFHGTLLMILGDETGSLDSAIMLPDSGIPSEGITLREVRALLA